MNYLSRTSTKDGVEKEHERLVVEASEYKGFSFLSIRIYFFDGSKWIPTKKGITVKPYEMRRFMEYVQKASEELDAKADQEVDMGF